MLGFASHVMLPNSNTAGRLTRMFVVNHQRMTGKPHCFDGHVHVLPEIAWLAGAAQHSAQYDSAIEESLSSRGPLCVSFSLFPHCCLLA